MTRIANIVTAAVVAITMGTAASSIAADSSTIVKVALTDMSASAGMGPMGQMMMGPNMMIGMMAIRIDQETIKAGPVKFDVTNWSRYRPHEMLVVAVDNPATALPYDYSEAKVNEDQVKVLGDTSELQPNKSASVEVTLAPGSYLLICNVPGHYAAGMAVPLVVKP